MTPSATGTFAAAGVPAPAALVAGPPSSSPCAPPLPSSKYIHAKDVALPAWQTFGLSGLAGCVAWCFTNPFEMWKNHVLTAPRGTSQVQLFWETKRKGFYRGFSTGIIRQTVYATSRLGFYPYIRRGLLETEVKLGIKETSDVTKANLLDRASAAALAGAFASFLSSPVDVCLVLQTTSKERVSLPTIVHSVYDATGVKGFWRGYGALGIRAAISGASQVGVHDHILTHLRLQNAHHAQPFEDNWVINTASLLTSVIYTALSMPFEYARVQLSMEAKKPTGVQRKYTSTFQCLRRVLREDGVGTIYHSFFPFLFKCVVHITMCFFVLEYGNRELRARQARSQGKILLLT